MYNISRLFTFTQNCHYDLSQYFSQISIFNQYMSDEDFNSKNWVWIPDDDEVFTKGYIVDYLDNNQCKVSYKLNNKDSTKILETSSLNPCNPLKFNKCNDMAELTHLNEPSVIYNLYLRYMDNMIYTYSGLFLVAINPYKSLLIYNPEKIDFSKPHIYSIAKSTHSNLVQNNKDQSILVTGESGAGKTENTKKIIQYLSTISSNDSIDEKILRTNPIMESFGNSKTIKNNNSSRFGKFIKLYFSDNTLKGADINYYLLEKSRVIHQQSGERNYHIFYQFLKSYKYLSKFELSDKIDDYKYLTNDDDGSNDEEEFVSLMESFKIIGLTDDEIENIFSILALILHLGNLDFSSWKSEQANFDKKSPVSQVLKILKVEKSAFETNLLRPKVKAGREYISKSKKPHEVKYAIDSLSKFLYETLFNFIIHKINLSLKLNDKRHINLNDYNFIGVLDIAGFEIFKINSFEQLCINYTNEKLQQFFNHHSFILEQSEYLKEDIKWDYIDFGKDLQPTIDLIENQKPPEFGIMKILDEECLMPKSSDKQFLDRLFTGFKKNSKFKPNKFKSGFIINHYAGQVEYNVDNWLDKNNDPISDPLLNLLNNSSNEFLKQIISLFNGGNTMNKNKKSLSMKYKTQLNDLMEELNNTEPHFVRCILPNLDKKPNKFDKNLVLNQLRCNGVLEGIRITRAGYPNKMVFEDFFSRYSILNLKEVFTKNFKTNCELIMKHIELDPETYKIGITKIFFKNGVLGNLEELRDLSIKGILTTLQSAIRGNLSRKVFKNKIEKIQNSQIIARNFSKIHKFKLQKTQGELWYSLFIQLKPLLEDSIKLMNNKEMNDNLKEIKTKLKDAEKLNKNYETEHKNITDSLSKLQLQYDDTQKTINDKDDMIKSLKTELKSSTERLKKLEKEIKELELEKSDLLTSKSKAIDDLEGLQVKHKDLSSKFESLTAEFDKINKSYESSKTVKEDFDVEKANHEKSIELLKVQQKKIQTLKDSNKVLKEDLDQKSKSETEIASKLEVLTRTNKELNAKHEELSKTLNRVKSTNDSKIEELNALLTKHKSGSTLDKSEITRLNTTVNKLKAENGELVDNLNKSNSELVSLKNELKDSMKSANALKDRLDEIDSLKKQLDEFKTKEQGNLDLISKLTRQLDESKKANEASSGRIKEYSYKIIELNDLVSKLENDKKEIEKEKENRPPAIQQNFQQVMLDYSNLKLKLNEINANLRTEKFENKKLIEELSVLKSKLRDNVSPYSSPNKASRRSIAIGEDPFSEGNKYLTQQIDDLKIKLEQEEANSTRAENYAIELQKKLNKLQNTRGLNSSIDLEKKYRESQHRVSELEKKFSSLFETVSPNTTPTKLTKSESFGRTSLISKTLENANQDFVKIYNDIARIARTTRDELTSSKLEILRLKSLLRESEDELYQIKREQHKTSIENYENELAQLKVKQDNLKSRNDDLNKSVELYKKRSDEYFKKLELAESAVTISKRHEEAATRELGELKTEYKLIKDELRASEIMIKDLNKEKSNLNNEIKDRDHHISKLLQELKEINDKLNYNKLIYENKEIHGNLKAEIQNLNNELTFKLNNESKLIKENKQLLIDNETLLKQKSNLERDFEDQLDKIDELEVKQDELSKKLRVLENEKAINERKIGSLNKQVVNLKDLVNDVTLQRDELLEIKDKLEEDNLILNQTVEDKTFEISSMSSDMKLLRSHLETQRMEALEIQQELNQSKISTTDDVTNYSKLKKENLVVSQENDALVRINGELKAKVSNLENKLYNDEQIKYWENKLDELNGKLDESNNENYKLKKTIYNFEQETKGLKIRFENDSKLIKKYNDENFDYQNKINHYKSSLDILQTENFEKDLQIKTYERDNLEMHEKHLLLEKEVLELRAKLGIP